MIKKLCLGFLLFFACMKISFAGTCTVDAFVSGNDVTIAHLESFRTTLVDLVNGNIDGDNIKDGSIRETDLNDEINPRVRWVESFNDYVYTGLLPTTSASLTTTTSLGTAYIKGYRVVKDATSKAYTASKWTYVDLSKDGTYTYSETVFNASEPATTANSIRLARVSSDATTINAIRDDRVLGIQIATKEDYLRSGLSLSVVTPDAITVGTGFVYHGSTRLKKTSTTSLNIGTAADWVNGVSGRAVSTMGFVIVDSVGNIKLSTTTPTKVDTDGNTTGTLRYSVISSTYYRLLGWFYMNATGSGNIDSYGYSNFKDSDVFNYIFTNASTDISTTSTVFVQMTDMILNFYSTGRPVEINFVAPTSKTDASVYGQILFDNVTVENTILSHHDGSTGTEALKAPLVISYSTTPSQGSHNVKVWWKTYGATSYQYGSSEGARYLKVEEK